MEFSAAGSKENCVSRFCRSFTVRSTDVNVILQNTQQTSAERVTGIPKAEVGPGWERNGTGPDGALSPTSPHWPAAWSLVQVGTVILPKFKIARFLTVMRRMIM